MHCSVSELEKQTCPVNHFFALIVELDSGCDSFRTEDLNGGGGLNAVTLPEFQTTQTVFGIFL